MQKRMLFIINPISGLDRDRSPLLDTLDLFTQDGYDIILRQTTQTGDATAFVKEHGDKVDLIVCSGGDGTLNETISGLIQLTNKPTLGYLPRGTTNDFAQSLGISPDPIKATQSMLRNAPRILDAGIWNGRSFVYIASFGAFTKSSYTTPQSMKNALGHFAYILEGIKDISSLRPYQIKVTADGETLDGEYLFGAICNSTSIGGLLHLSDECVVLDDGLFELLLIPSPQSLNDLHALIRTMHTQDFNSDDMVFRHVSSFHLETVDDLPWALDGEFAESAPVVDIINYPQAIKILV